MGERIAMLRKHLGLTQAELGKRIHVSASTIGMYEHERRMPTIDILCALSQEFGVSLDYLLLGSCSYSFPGNHFAQSPAGSNSLKSGTLCELSGYLCKTELLLLMLNLLSDKSN